MCIVVPCFAIISPPYPWLTHLVCQLPSYLNSSSPSQPRRQKDMHLAGLPEMLKIGGDARVRGYVCWQSFLDVLAYCGHRQTIAVALHYTGIGGIGLDAEVIGA